MSFRYWERDRRDFHEKRFRRATLSEWDARWHGLSATARDAFVRGANVPSYRNRRAPPGAPAGRFSPEVLGELTAAGFLARRGNEVIVPEAAYDFAARLHVLRQYRLLTGGRPENFRRYVEHCFEASGARLMIHHVLEAAGVNPYGMAGDPVERYVSRRRWAGWVADYLRDSRPYREVLAAVEAADGRLRLDEVAAGLPGKDPAAVRAALDELVTHLVLVEDLQPDSNELLVGLLPSVLEDQRRSAQPGRRPALTPVPTPREVGPEGGVDVPDVRAVLLQLAGGRTRLRQDRSLFHKEAGRFLGALDPLPPWFADHFRLSPEHRLDIALGWARGRLTQEDEEGRQKWLELREAGRHWLAQPVPQQYAWAFRLLREPDGVEEYAWGGSNDSHFLASSVSAIPEDRTRAVQYLYEVQMRPERRRPLREALWQAFGVLQVGVYYRLRDFVAHTVFGSHNPLLLGRAPQEVSVRDGNRLLPPLEEEREEAARRLLHEFILNRLIPLGCLQAGRDTSGELLITRRPRLDEYFGHPPAQDTGPAAGGETRVVVQPDFSVLLIGLDSSPAAELAPVCERVQGRPGEGAVTYRLTRDSVARAVAAGLRAEDILSRLEKHARTPVPGNVAQEVREWCAWVRRVTLERVLLLRCPDAAAADRVIGVLGRRVERLNETTLAVSEGVTAAQRQKMRDQGLLVTDAEAAT
jgi:hypothetical protein